MSNMGHVISTGVSRKEVLYSEDCQKFQQLHPRKEYMLDLEDMLFTRLHPEKE